MFNPRIATTLLALTLAGSALALAPTFLRQEMPQPTAEHREVLASVGTWEGTMTSFMPDAPSEPTRAVEVVEAIGGFWTQVRFECDFMGMPYVGTGCAGYDETKNKYVGTWIDSMSSFMAIMEGEVDAETGAVVMHWDAPDMTGEMVPHRSETTRTEDSYTSTFYTNDVKSMVIAMKRKAKPVEAGSKR